MSELSIPQNSPSEKYYITITIDSIENVIGKDATSISFIIEHNDINLGESSLITIEPHLDDTPLISNVGFSVQLPVDINNREIIDPIVSTPILIKAVQGAANNESSKSAISENGGKRRSKFTLKSPNTPRIIGVCSLDIIPIVLGESSFAEKLILETPEFSLDECMVSWPNLPLLNVTVSQFDSIFFEQEELVNFLNITVESIYNVPGNFNDKMEYKAGTVIYVDSEVPENIFFEGARWTKYRDVQRRKYWSTLCELENRARLSKYKLDCDFMGIKNVFKNQFDVNKKMREDAPRIEWNSMSRRGLQNGGVEAIKKHISKYNYWPFQFMLTEKSSERNSETPPTKTSGRTSNKLYLYQCYVDVSELLFPGRNSARVVAQLYSYNPSDITEKVGLERNIFDNESYVKEPKEKIGEREKRSKTSKSTQSDTVISASNALCNNNGEPTLIIIEMEFYRPLIPSRVSKDFTFLIEQLMPVKGTKPRYPYSGDVAEEQYKNCIQKVVEIMTESYRDFCEENADENSNSEVKRYTHDSQDEINLFTQYLYKTGVYASIRTTLRAKVTMLLDQKFRIDSHILDSAESQNSIALIYTYLVEQMHMAVNKIVEGRFVNSLSNNVDPEKFYFYAEEAYELGQYDNAKQYYLRVIESNKNDPDAWTKYAVFLIKVSDFHRARECIQEAILLNRRHKMALLLYAGLLFASRQYREAEIFFITITELHPRFMEGWVILHLFFIRTEFYPGIDIAIRTAQKCFMDKEEDGETDDKEPLAWSTFHCPPDGAYAKTAALLFKLHLCELAGIALAQEMLDKGETIHISYYLAVDHYLSHRYEDAISHLKEAQTNYGRDYYLSSLMGHCYFQLGDFENAIESYEFARMTLGKPNDIHLVDVRMGLHYNNIENYQKAKEVFLCACDSSPTAQTWFGVGISFYQLGELPEAEAAFSEAIRIDNRNPDIWAYLCLLNMSLRRYEEFAQCYREIIKNNLTNVKLWLIITESMEALGYVPPSISSLSKKDNFDDDDNTNESEEEFEQNDSVSTTTNETGNNENNRG